VINWELANTAEDRAEQFINNPGPNLRYLGLISITRLMEFNKAIISLPRERQSGVHLHRGRPPRVNRDVVANLVGQI
jgi:hypothetical protein